MGNLSHTVGGTDNLVSFKSAARVPIDSLKVHFKPIQEGEGDPSPENVRPIRGWNEVEAYKSGKNIAQVTGYNAMNSANADIHNKLSNDYGTTISTNNFGWPDTSVTITQTTAPNNNSITSYQNGYFTVMVKNLIYGCDYDVSFKVTDIKNNLLNCSLDNINIASQGRLQYKCSEIKDNVLIFKNVKWIRYSEDPMNSHYNRSGFEIRNCGMSFTLSEFMVTPVGMNDGVFEPYCGEVIPVTFPVIGKNKFNGEISNTNISFDGQIGSSTGNRISTSLISIAHGQYTLSSSENYPVAIYAYDDNGFVENDSLVTWQESPVTFTVENAKYVRFKWKKTDDSAFSPSEITNIQLELGSEATVYEPYNPDNTIYGGYADLAKGEVVAEWAKVTKKLSDCTQKGVYDDITSYVFRPFSNLSCFAMSENGHAGTITSKNSKCSIAPLLFAGSDRKVNHYYIFRDNNSTRLLLYLTPSSIEPEADMEFEVAFRLKDPISYPLTSTQLQTFLNDNAFWSNTNDTTEVSYTIHDSAPIHAAKKRIIAANPHLETASDDLVNFSTDVAAPLKECKVYFEPVQEGEGDPSPENIRPIGGWNNIEVTKCGKNLFDISEMASRTGVTVDGDTFVGTARNIGALGNYSYGYNIKRTTLHIPSNISINVSCMTYSEGNISTNGAGFSLNFFNENGTMLRPWYTYNSTLSSSLHNGMITPVDDVIYYVFGWYNNADNIWHVSNMQFEIGSSMTEYESYNGTTIPITFPSEAGAIYGGYVDLVKGEIVEEYALFEKTWGELTLRGTLSNTDYKSMDLDKDIYESSEYSYVSKLSNIVPYSYSWTENDSPHFYVSNSRRIYVWLPIGTEASTTIQIIGHLKEPIHYPIDPQTLKTLRGTNNIWSTSNGPITIKYWKH